MAPLNKYGVDPVSFPWEPEDDVERRSCVLLVQQADRLDRQDGMHLELRSQPAERLLDPRLELRTVLLSRRRRRPLRCQRLPPKS